MPPAASALDPIALERELAAGIERAIARFGTTEPIRPSHRVKFLWPPHPVAYSYHVLTSDWTGTAEFEAYGERFDVAVARTPHGVFGRCDALWCDARGEDEGAMLRSLRETVEPLVTRQRLIAETIETLSEGRERRAVAEMEPREWLALLYCPDRDVANDAHWHIERNPERAAMLPALLAILRDRRHPHRRSAQWCVLDLFEDLPSFLPPGGDGDAAISAILGLLMDARDDYARTVYKAGVVLGGHLAHFGGFEALLAALDSTSKIGRRSAIHALFHVVEWRPELRPEVVARLREQARTDSEPLLARFAAAIALDVENSATDHVLEPTFPEEAEPTPR